MRVAVDVFAVIGAVCVFGSILTALWAVILTRWPHPYEELERIERLEDERPDNGDYER